MSILIGRELDAELLRRLGGEDLPAVSDKVIPIVTVDDAGWPHPALLSYFEVVARDPRDVRLATYSGSTTTANLRRNGRLTLIVIDERVVYYIKGRAAELAPGMTCAPELSKLQATVETVLADVPDERYEPGAYISSGITYVNPKRLSELVKATRVLAELLE